MSFKTPVQLKNLIIDWFVPSSTCWECFLKLWS